MRGRGPSNRDLRGKADNFGLAMKKLILFMKPWYPIILLSLCLAACASICNILAPGFLSDFTNNIAVAAFGQKIDMSALLNTGIILICLYVGNALLNAIQTFIMAGVTQNVSKKMRTSISYKINKIPLAYFDKKAYGDTLSVVTNDVDTIAQTLESSVATLLQSVVLFVGVLIAMFVTRWEMALTVVLTVPISMVIVLLVVSKSQPMFVKQRSCLGELNGQIEENFSGQSIIKIFNAEDKKQREFDKVNTELLKNTWTAQFFSGLMMPAMSLVSNLGYVAVCVVGALLYKQDPVTMAGVIVSFFVYVRLFQNPINQLAQAFNQRQSTAAAAERVFALLEETEQSDESDKPKRIEKVKGEVEFRHVSFGYDPDRIIIKDFSAKVEPGMKVAIVGPTGAGKTTMVNLIMRFYEVTSGDILIDGVSVKDMKREEVRDMFSMVLQDTWLFEGTIRENIVYSKEGVTEQMLDDVAKASNIDYFVKALPDGYDTVLGEESNVSGGQKQLITIARAMIQNSPMMILDEATSNVDTRTEELIQEAMDRLTAGRTSFVIAHRLSTIKNADMILVMKDGNIVEQGNHETLMEKNGFYASLYNSQFAQEE
ncbi:MAG: ABC transporter ATP-binding protein/permease [Christensenellaceae bacterium]|nr:ABC transporter ATP-binding protein/permease [Christensenellaceae bacterium]